MERFSGNFLPSSSDRKLQAILASRNRRFTGKQSLGAPDFSHKATDNSTQARPSPLFRAGEKAISVCSVILHCEKYHDVQITKFCHPWCSAERSSRARTLLYKLHENVILCLIKAFALLIEFVALLFNFFGILIIKRNKIIKRKNRSDNERIIANQQAERRRSACEVASLMLREVLQQAEKLSIVL